MSVVELLPSGLQVNADTSAFLLELAPLNVDFTLGAFCAPCAGFGGITTEKPAFSGSLSAAIPLPSAVRAVVVQDGAIDIEIGNGFDFDPINPSAAANGTLTIRLVSGGTTVAQTELDGATDAMPVGETVSLTLELLEVTIADDFEIELTLDSPAGDSATMSASDALSVTVSSQGIEVSEATVDLGAHPIDQEVDLDLDGVDLADDVTGGTVFLDITNPFGVTGNLLLTIDPEDGAPIVKPLPLAAGESQVAIDFSEAELGQIIGQPSATTLTGALNGTGVTVAPDMVIGIEMRLRVSIELGGTDDNEGED